MRKFFLAALLVLGLSASSFAVTWWNHGIKREIHTLIITGNYKSSRLLAEVVQNHNNQPYLLIGDFRNGDNRIFFCGAKHNIQVSEHRYNDFIRTMNPKRIIILGDENCIPAKYSDMLDGYIPVIRISGRDWDRVAEEVNFMLGLSHMDSDYRELRKNMINDSNFYRPVSRPLPEPAKQDAKQDAAASPKEQPAEKTEVLEIPASATAAPQNK